MPLTKERMEQYRILNKERIAEQRAEYFQDNKAEIQSQRSHSKQQKLTRLEYLAEEVACPNCNKYLKRKNMGKHRKSNICKQGIETTDWSKEAMIKLREEYKPKN